jgi:exopolysaccharide biosynthesis polyprenyl glycosylphosphotransferase
MKIRILSIFAVISFFLDGFMITASFVGANWIRFYSGWIHVGVVTPYSHYRSFVTVFVLIHLVVFKYVGLYRQRRGVSGVDELSKILQAVFIASIILSAATFLAKFFAFSRLVIALSAFLITLTVWFERILLRRVQIGMRRRGMGVTRVLIVGSGETARVLIQRLQKNPGLGYRVIGVVSESKSSGQVEGFKIIGILSHFSQVVKKHNPAEVIFALPATAHAQLIPMLVSLQESQVKYKIVSDLFGLITHPLENDVLLDMPIFQMKEAPLNSWYNRAMKRAFDFSLALAGVVILIVIPVLPVLALGVKLSSSGPIFFRQKRVGRDGKHFSMLKFRSMAAGTETVAFTAKNDPRVTKFGSFIRKTSLDELPQIFNVLLGNMSLVGPRPEVPGLVEKFEKEIPRYFERHQVKSGITGWAQVNGFRGNTSLHERIKYDIYYIENWNLGLDVKIMIRTVLDILEHEDAY